MIAAMDLNAVPTPIKMANIKFQNLTARKLMPALFNLYQHGGLPKPFAIVGCGRTRIDADHFREK